MSRLVSFSVYDAFGNPNPTATPSFLVHKNSSGASITPPTINNLGGGLFAFNVPRGDVGAGVAMLIQGASTPPQYWSGTDGGPLQAFALYDGSGNPIAGNVPVITTYVDANDEARAAPAIRDFGSGLYAFLVPTADYEVGVSFQINCGPNVQPAYFSGFAQRLMKPLEPQPSPTFSSRRVNVRPALDYFLTGRYLLTRSVASQLINGRVQCPWKSRIPVWGCVQPASGRDLQILEEGLRTKETRKFLSGVPILGQGKEQEADVLEIGGYHWQVQNVKDWSEPAGYWKAIIQRAGNG